MAVGISKIYSETKSTIWIVVIVHLFAGLLMALFSPFNNGIEFFQNLCFIAILIICFLVGIFIPGILALFLMPKHLILEDRIPDWVATVIGVLGLMLALFFVYFAHHAFSEFPAPLNKKGADRYIDEPVQDDRY